MIPQKSEKQTLRQTCRAQRKALSHEQVTHASRAVAQHLSNWEPIKHAQVILAYLAFRNEIVLAPLFEHLPHIHWILPRVQKQHLILHPYDPARLVRHRYGMLEPDAALPAVDPREIDLVLIPGLAFDHRGARLGFGGGYYDRFLPTTPALRVGIAYHIHPHALPTELHDQHVDWIVTPQHLVSCRALFPPAGGPRPRRNESHI